MFNIKTEFVVNKKLILEIKSFVPYRPLIQITPTNWKPIIYSALIQGIKFLEDRVFWNIDFVERTNLFGLYHTNKWEHLYLNILDFKMSIHQSEIEQYFKQLIHYRNIICK